MKFQPHLVSFLIGLCVLGHASAGRVVCYYASWAGYSRCTADQLDPFICTHIIYSFVGLDSATNKIKHLDSQMDVSNGGLAKLVALRQKNPNLKTMVAIGGWNEGTYTYSNMASDPNKRQVFVQSVVDFLTKFDLNGLDVDWEYPGSHDKQTYITLLSELSTALHSKGFLLSVAIGAGVGTIQTSYNIPSLNTHVDFINIMSYDYHGAWETTTNHHSPLYARPEETGSNAQFNVDTSVQLLLSLGASPDKLTLGIGAYGVSFTLASSSNHGYGAPVTGPGYPGSYLWADGVLAYQEILPRLQSGWTVVRNANSKVPYAYSGNQWVGYDDEESVRAKVQYAKSLGLGGGMVWTIDEDDFLGTYGKKYPLTSIIKEEFSDTSDTTTTTTQGSTGTGTITTPTTTTTTTTTTTPAPTDDLNSYLMSKCPTQTYVRHPTDCSIFYQCIKSGSQYTTYMFQCQTGLYFDTTAIACNWSNLVTC